jgi:anaerobic magnesium-protoporphyrin IX monomethyl ester cyclase
LLYLGAVLEKAGHEVQIVDLRKEENIDVRRQVAKANFVGLTATSGEIVDAKRIARQVKTYYGKQVVTIVGGAHPSLLPEDCINHFDCVVVGEGEKSILEIVENGARGLVNSSPIKDLDTIPFPARHLVGEKAFSHTLWPGEKYGKGPKATTLIGSRGCFWQKCAFCGNIRQPLRLRSPANIVEEIKQVRDQYGCYHYRFEDDDFTFNKKRCLKLCEELKPLGIHYKAHSRSDLLDEEICQALKQSGCDEFGIGVESADNHVLETVDKGLTVEDHKKAIKLLKEAGIITKAYFIIGLPGETEETIEKNMQFVKETGIDKWTISIFMPYPGCPIACNPTKYGVKIVDHDWSHYWNFPDYPCHELTDPPATRQQIWKRYKRFYEFMRSEAWRKS